MILLIQNNADKRIWAMDNLTPDITNHLWVKFENFEFPEDVADGEYTYALIAGTDAEYQYKAELLDTLINGTLLRDLHPAVGLLRIGMPVDKNQYAYEPEKDSKGQNNKHYYYYNK